MSDHENRTKQDEQDRAKPDSAKPEEARAVPEERSVTAQRTVTIGDAELAYTATAATLHLKDGDGKARASIFHVAYTRDDADPAERPITFAFNGGPGSAAVWLQLGTFGPRRVELPDAAVPAPPPHRIVDNEHSILDRTDLVFIDPVGTGFSRSVGEGEDADYHSLEGDLSSVVDFIRAYLGRSGRWASPRFLAGESYGTTRAAGLAGALQREGIVLNGIALISPVLNFQTIFFETGNDLPYVLYLPTYAAAAWYHRAVEDRPAELGPFLEEARQWAMDVYGPALMRGAGLAADARAEVVRDLARFTGLSPTYLERANLRVSIGRFARELLRDRGQTIGRMDSRYLGYASDGVGEALTQDPSLDGPYGPYATAINDYLRRELGYETDDKYEIISFKVNESWKFDVDKRFGFPNTAETLRLAMLQNPHLRVFFANGYYDMATPFFASEHTARHLGAEPHLQANITEAWYEGGHMMYLHPPSLAKLREDLVAFYDDALG